MDKPGFEMLEESSTFSYDQVNDSTVDNNDPIYYSTIQALFCVVYTTIFVLGIFGNVLICYVVYQNRAMQTVTNFFITNLALSDILLCALAVPFTPLYTFKGEWVFGPALCHTVPFAQGISIYISTLTLTSIAVDRFFVIIYPFRPRMKISTCFIIILSIWAVSILATVPYGIYMKLIDHNVTVTNVTIYFCEEQWPSDDWREIFGAVTVTMQFIVPFCVIAFCYIKVSLKLNDRARSRPGTKNSRKEEADRERKRRTNRMLIAMVSIFGFSWLPFNCVNFLNDFHLNIANWEYYNLCFFLVHALAMSSTCYNPFLYAWLNENFRKEFKQVLPGFDSSTRRSSNERMGGWRSERTCNGNETVQESLLQSSSMVRRCSSIRIQLAEATKDVKNALESKTDLVEVENVLIPKVSYDTHKDEVELHLTTDDTVHLRMAVEENRSSPPSEGKTGELMSGLEKLRIGCVHGEVV